MDHRSTARLDYMGEIVRVYRYYHHAIFSDELRAIGVDLTPTTSCERHFIVALERTNGRMANWSICRRLADSECFQGPQSYADRFTVARMQYEPPSLQAEHRGHRSRSTSHRHGWLQCGDAACNKWRRVDAASMAVWDNQIYFGHMIASQARRLDEARPKFLTAVINALKQHAIEDM